MVNYGNSFLKACLGLMAMGSSELEADNLMTTSDNLLEVASLVFIGVLTT